MKWKTKVTLGVLIFSGVNAVVEADVVFNQMSGSLGAREIMGRRGMSSDISVYIDMKSLQFGGVVWHQNAALTGDTWSIGSVAYPQPSVINGIRFNVEGGAAKTGLLCGNTGLSLTVDSWSCGGWSSMAPLVSGYIPMKLIIPSNMPVGRTLVNIPVKVCAGRSVYHNAISNPWGIVQQWAGECQSKGSALVTMPTYVTVLNKCNASATQINLDHKVVTKGINSEGNIAFDNLTVTCDGPTSVNISFSGTGNLNGHNNSVSLKDGWISQLSTEIDGNNVVGNVSFSAENSKIIKIKSTLYGEKDATPGVKVASGAALIMSYN